MPTAKKSKEDANKEIMGDVSKSSATKQIIIGSTSGWYVFCGFVIIVYFPSS